MAKFDYSEYEAVFNTGDEDALMKNFYAEDIVFISGPRTKKGREELSNYLKWAHQGVNERMRPQTVIRNGNKIFAEVDMDFHSTVYRDDWPYAKLRPGDTVSIKFFALYTLNADEKVSEFKAMTWAPGVGISKYPRLGGSNNQRAAFMAFAAGFSAGEFETFPKFYTSDVVLKVPSSHAPVEGFDAVVKFYKDFFAKIQETLEVEQLICDDAGICAKMIAHLTALEDTKEPFGDFRKGEKLSLKVYVVYGLRDGLISSIEVRGRD